MPEYQPMNIFTPHYFGAINAGDDGILYARNIAPLSQMAVAAFVWYQGESNAGNPGAQCAVEGGGCGFVGSAGRGLGR